MPSAIAARDGTLSFSAGVNSVSVTTVQSPGNPDGLPRNSSAWLINYTCRDGGLTQRFGWVRVGEVATASGLFQGKFLYEPLGATPYEIWSVSGHILRVDVDTGAVTDLSTSATLTNPATETHAYFEQAEEFLVIQAGDYGKGGPVVPGITDALGNTLPLFWDGNTLRRSNGLTGNIGQPSATIRYFTATAFFKIPSVASTVTIPISTMYPGVALEQGVMRGVGGQFDIGTFTVTAFTAVAPFTVTIRTDSSQHIGENFPPFEYQLTLTAVPAPVLINEIPAATAMCYYMYRLWYAQGRIVSAGDLVFGPSGTAAYGYRDSVLKVTENPLAIGGDGFAVSSQDGSIRALQYGANIDAANGQGRLFIGTRKAWYALQVPVNREDWIDAGTNNQPLLTVVQLANGPVNDRSVVPVNGDLFYQSLEPGIRSLVQSGRLFGQPGNIEISANENRILQFQDRALMQEVSGIFFDNRLLQTVLPEQTPQGVIHSQIVPLDFVPISTFNQQRQPNWEGSYQAMPVFQLLAGDFGGRERAFAAVRSETGAIELWELTIGQRFDYAAETSDDARRIVSVVELPAFTWSNSIGEEELKKITGAEIAVDRIFGTVEFTLEYRPDFASCWVPWHQWKVCNPKNTAEIAGVPPGYPVPYGECYRNTLWIPKPPDNCAPCGTGRPANQCYQCQPRLTIKGWHRLRGFWVWAEPLTRGQYPNTGSTC